MAALSHSNVELYFLIFQRIMIIIANNILAVNMENYFSCICISGYIPESDWLYSAKTKIHKLKNSQLFFSFKSNRKWICAQL